MTNPTPPEGWVLLPEKPTVELFMAFRRGWDGPAAFPWDAFKDGWREILAAAPTPPAAGQSLESDPGTASTPLSDRLLRLAEGWEKEVNEKHPKFGVRNSGHLQALRHAAQQVREALGK